MPILNIPIQTHQHQVTTSLTERIVCSIAASVKYGIPANIMLAVAQQEGGKAGQAVVNTNGSVDYGAMQINTAWLADLRKYGITARDVTKAGCYAYDLAAWRIRQHIKHDTGSLWQRVANYHSYTPRFNLEYRRQIERKAGFWMQWLQKRFVTVEVQSQPKDTAKTSQPVVRAQTRRYTKAYVMAHTTPRTIQAAD